MEAGPGEQRRREAQPDGRVVVAGGEHDLRPGVDQPSDRLGEQLDGRRAGQRAVVDVAAHQHRVDPFGAHDIDEVVDVASLGGQHPHTVERASQVPVGGVDQPHVPEARAAGGHGLEPTRAGALAVRPAGTPR